MLMLQCFSVSNAAAAWLRAQSQLLPGLLLASLPVLPYQPFIFLGQDYPAYLNRLMPYATSSI